MIDGDTWVNSRDGGWEGRMMILWSYLFMKVMSTESQEPIALTH